MGRGIVDPWRVTVPLKEEPRPPRGERIDLDQIDLDEDIRASGSYVLRTVHACLRVDHPDVVSPETALATIVARLLQAVKDGECARAMRPFGLRLGAQAWRLPVDEQKASSFVAGEAAIFFKDASLDEGMLDLVRRMSAEPLRRNRHLRSLTPMLR